MPMMPSLQGMSQAVVAFKGAAAGGFQVSGAGVEVLIAAVNELRTAINHLSTDVNHLAQEWPIGTTPGAETYRPHFAATAADPHQGVIAKIGQLADDLAEISENLKKSKAVYDDVDHRNAQNQQSIGRTLSA